MQPVPAVDYFQLLNKLSYVSKCSLVGIAFQKSKDNSKEAPVYKILRITFPMKFIVFTEQFRQAGRSDFGRYCTRKCKVHAGPTQCCLVCIQMFSHVGVKKKSCLTCFATAGVEEREQRQKTIYTSSRDLELMDRFRL